MPVIVLASPKGGVGKSTCAVLLAIGFARMGAEVILIDADPNESLSQWVQFGLPKGITALKDTSSRIASTIRESDGHGRVVIVDTEGIASQAVSRATAMADLVIVPMQPTTLDAAIGSRALALVRDEAEILRRPIRSAVVLTKTGAIKTRIQRQLEADLAEAEVDLIEPPLANRTAFAELFTYGGDLEAMAARKINTGGNIDAAIANAQVFVEAVYDRLAKAE